MKSKPEIIKELREAEKFGRFQSKVQGVYEKLEVPEESPESVSGKTVGFADDYVEWDKGTDAVSGENTWVGSQKMEKMYRLITENTDDLIAVAKFSLNPKYTYVSPSHEKIMGYKPEELLGNSCLFFVHPDDKKKLIFLLRKYVSAKGEKLFTGKDSDVNAIIEYRAKDKSGNWHYLESTANIMGNELLLVSKDITERKQAEEKLKESEEKFRSLYSSMNEGVCLHKIEYNDSGDASDYRIIDVNPKYEKILSLDKKNVINKLASEIYATGEPPYMDIYAKVAETGEPTQFETYFPPMDKHFSISVFSPGKGKFATVFEDITERKKTEEKISMSNKKFQEIFNAVSDAIFIHDLKDLSIIDVNDETCKRFGYTREEIKKMSIDELSEGKSFSTDISENQELFGKIMNGKIVTKEWLSKNKDGDTFWHEMTVKLVEIEGEKRLLTIARNIDERKKTEERMKESEKKYRSLFDTSRDAIMTLAPPDWKFTSGNHATIELFEAKDEAEFISNGPWNVSPEKQPNGQFSSDEAKKMIGQAMETGSSFFEWIHKTLDGKEFSTTVLLTRIEIEKGKPFLQATVRDITERKKIEEKLKHKLNELEIFHDVAVDRELKMIELKNEINELCEKHGEKPRYNVEYDE